MDLLQRATQLLQPLPASPPEPPSAGAAAAKLDFFISYNGNDQDWAEWIACQPEGILQPIVYADLLGLDEPAARQRLLARIRGDRLKPSRPPGFPGQGAAPGFPSRAKSDAIPAGLLAVRQALLAGQAIPELSGGALQETLRHPPRTLEEYRLARIADWSQERYALDKRFTRLTLLLDELLESGRLVLLLDAVNELPHADATDYANRIALWRDFLVALPPGTRVVFSCRSLDYSALLSTPEGPVYRSCASNRSATIRSRPSSPSMTRSTAWRSGSNCAAPLSSTCSVRRSTCGCCSRRRVSAARLWRARRRCSPASSGKPWNVKSRPATAFSSTGICSPIGNAAASSAANGPLIHTNCRRTASCSRRWRTSRGICSGGVGAVARLRRATVPRRRGSASAVAKR